MSFIEPENECCEKCGEIIYSDDDAVESDVGVYFHIDCYDEEMA